MKIFQKYKLIILLISIILLFISFIFKDEKRKEKTAKENKDSIVLIYEDDKIINDFLLKYNKNNNSKINRENIKKYYHHGQEHNDQILIDIENITYTISSTYVNAKKGIKIFVDNVNQNNKNKIINMIYNFLIIYNDQITINDITNIFNEKNYKSSNIKSIEYSIQIFNNKIEYVSFEFNI